VSARRLVAAVRRRVEADLAVLPGGADEAWRGRVADETTLLLALLQGIEGDRPDPDASADDAGPEDAAALIAQLRDMAGRGVPLRPVQRFVRAAAAAAFAEFWQVVGPGDATALLCASRRLSRRRHILERQLRRAYEPDLLPRALEVV
jgi:hypothetical protein